MKKASKIALLFLFGLFPTSAIGQTCTVTGTARNLSNNPVGGVKIVVESSDKNGALITEGKKVVATSAANGTFSFVVSCPAYLRVSAPIRGYSVPGGALVYVSEDVDLSTLVSTTAAYNLPVVISSGGGGGGGVADGDKGDISVSGSGATWTVDASAITSTKILDGTILNADINANAAIALSKLNITGTPTGSKFLRDDGSWQSIGGGGDALTSNPLSQFASTTSAQLAGVISNETGSGAAVFANSPTLVTPSLGTPSAVVLTNATGLPISTGISGLGTGVATLLAIPSSANLASAITDETGTGAAVFGTAPTIAGGSITGLTSFGIRSTGAAFDLTLASAEVFTAGRTLTFALGDTSRMLTIGASASVSGTNTGDQTTISGNAGTATALQTARTINGTSFDGTANITVTAAAGTLTGSTLASGVTTSSLTSFGTITSGTLSTGAVLGGVTMTLGSDANGDTYYRSGGVLTRLAKGTAGQVLTMNAGATAPEWATASGGGGGSWSGLTNPTANQSLDMSAYTSTWTANTALTNTVNTLLSVGHNTSGTPAAGFGTRVLYKLETTTTTGVDAAAQEVVWTDATSSNGVASIKWYVNNSAGLQNHLTLAGGGSLTHTGRGTVSLNDNVLVTSYSSGNISNLGGGQFVISTDTGWARKAAGVSRFSDGSTGAGQLLIGAQSDTISAQLHAISQSAARIGGLFEGAASNSAALLVAKSGSSGTGDAFQAQNSSGTVLAAITSGGRFQIGASGAPVLLSGSGTPESAITAPVGSVYLRTDGGAGTSMYIKESGSGSTGWVAK